MIRRIILSGEDDGHTNDGTDYYGSIVRLRIFYDYKYPEIESLDPADYEEHTFLTGTLNTGLAQRQFQIEFMPTRRKAQAIQLYIGARPDDLDPDHQGYYTTGLYGFRLSNVTIEFAPLGRAVRLPSAQRA